MSNPNALGGVPAFGLGSLVDCPEANAKFSGNLSAIIGFGLGWMRPGSYAHMRTDLLYFVGVHLLFPSENKR